jgi:DNA-directed RNA polymerase I, II, and III subunit RPABC2
MDEDELEYTEVEQDYPEEYEDLEQTEDIESEVEEQNTDEILTDSSDFVENKERVTSAYLNKYERTKVLGMRALQISVGAVPLVDIGETTDAYEIALLELKQKKCPFVIRRYLPNNTYEDWKVSELIIIDDLNYANDTGY